jgi:hypothetical protein
MKQKYRVINSKTVLLMSLMRLLKYIMKITKNKNIKNESDEKE